MERDSKGLTLGDGAVRHAVQRKNFYLDEGKVQRARRILGTKTEIETVTRALDLVIFRKEILASLPAFSRSSRRSSHTFVSTRYMRQSPRHSNAFFWRSSELYWSRKALSAPAQSWRSFPPVRRARLSSKNCAKSSTSFFSSGGSSFIRSSIVFIESSFVPRSWRRPCRTKPADGQTAAGFTGITDQGSSADPQLKGSVAAFDLQINRSCRPAGAGMRPPPRKGVLYQMYFNPTRTVVCSLLAR